jgi:hypothetical protein
MVIPNGETDVRWGIFKDCSSLTSVTIPNTVTSIREYAFSGCSSLKNITIPDSVTEIEISAFEFCPNLTSITIPASVSVIDKRAFGYAGWDGIDEKLDGFKIYGYGDDSAAAKYAKNNGFDYEALHTHNYTSKVTKEATCTKAGEITKTCSCGDVQKETVPATGKHTTVTDKAVAATCVKAGKTEGSHCSVCGTVIKAQKTVAATGKHTYKTTKVVKATTSAKGYTLKTCSVCKATTKTDYTDKLIALSKCKATIPSSSYTYTGKALKPTVTVKSGSTKLKSGTDYTVSYKNNKNTGKATITITGKGKYTGTLTKTFNIVPKKATLSSVTSPKTKNVKVTWKKDTQATGYEVVYATNSKFTSGKKTVTVTKNSTTSKTISKLTKGKTYYVKVRSYKTINGKKIYGAYSAAKKVKCK